jgi:hypothetical protein
MKTSNTSEFLAPGAATVSFKSLSSEDIRLLLPPFYSGLDFDARRARFCCAVSDDSIVRHCSGLHPDNAIVLGCVGRTGLIAAIELHPLSPFWEDVELAVADRAAADRITILGHLLQLAVFAAGKRGCSTFIVPLGPSDRDLLALLRSIGRVRVQDDHARVDLGDYARMQRHSNSRI